MPADPDSQKLLESLSSGRTLGVVMSISSKLLVLTLVLLTSIRLAFSELQFYHDADSILPALISTIKWTWFYWGQNRLGTLVPLLAVPIRTEFANLMFQSWVTIAAGVYALLIIPGWILGCRRAWVGGLCACTLFFALFSRYAVFQYVSTGLPYAVSMALVFSSLRLTDSSCKRASHLVSFGLMCLGIWVNIGIYPLAFGLLLARCVATGWSKRRLVVLAMLSAAFGLNSIGARLYSIRTKGTFGLDIGDIDDNILPLLQSIGKHIETNFTVLTLLACVIAAAVCFTLLRQRRRAAESTKSMWLQILSALCGTLGFLLLLSSSDWVRVNLYHVRYTVPIIIMCCGILGAVCELTARSYANNNYARYMLLVSLTVLLVGFVHIRFSYAGHARIMRKFDKAFGRHSESIIDEGVQVVYGDFRDVWPGVFHSRIRLREEGIDRIVLGITDRSEDTRPLWWALIQEDAISARIAKSRWPCIPADNTDYAREAAFALPMVFVDERRSGTLVIGKFALPGKPDKVAP